MIMIPMVPIYRTQWSVDSSGRWKTRNDAGGGGKETERLRKVRIALQLDEFGSVKTEEKRRKEKKRIGAGKFQQQTAVKIPGSGDEYFPPNTNQP